MPDRPPRWTLRWLMIAIAGLALLCEVVRENGVGPAVVGGGGWALIGAARRLGQMTWRRAVWLVSALYPWIALLAAIGLTRGVILLRVWSEPEAVASTLQALWFLIAPAFLAAVVSACLEAHREVGRTGSSVWIRARRAIALPLISWSIAWFLLVGFVFPGLRAH